MCYPTRWAGWVSVSETSLASKWGHPAAQRSCAGYTHVSLYAADFGESDYLRTAIEIAGTAQQSCASYTYLRKFSYNRIYQTAPLTFVI